MQQKMLKALSILIIFSTLFPISAAGSPPKPPEITVLESDITVTADVSDVAIDPWYFVESQWQHKNQIDADAHLPLSAYMVEPDQARLEKDVDRTLAFPGDTAQYTITLINDSPLTTTFVLSDTIPENASYVLGSTMGGLDFYPIQNVLTGTVELGPPKMNIVADSLYGYLSLADFTVDPPFIPRPCPDNNCDNSAIALSGFDFYFYGQHVTDLVWSTNGYIQVGTEISSLSEPNQDLPDPAAPNNLIAPLWMDFVLDSCSSGSSKMGWYRGFVTDGVYDYYVIEWKEAALKSNPDSCFSFQVWIKRGTDQIWFVYGPQTDAVETATVGIENPSGSAGFTYYYNGNSSAPIEGSTLKADRIDRAVFTYSLEIGDDIWTDVTNVAEATNTSSVKQASATVQMGEHIFLPVLSR